MELSSKLRRRCKEVFEGCNQFDSNEQLHDFMAIAPLKHFYSDVEAGTKEERINRCLARLPEKIWNEQEVFLHFVHELCQQYREGDRRHQSLDHLFNDLQAGSEFINAALPGKSSGVVSQNRQQGSLLESDQSKNVLVIHSQNETARREISAFLKGANLIPVEWKHIEMQLQKSSPSVDEVLSLAFNKVQAVMVVFTSDDFVEPGRGFANEHDLEHLKEARMQPIPDLLFKAGVAFGMKPARTILVALGNVRPFHPFLERHVIRLTDNDEDRKEVIAKLQQARCFITGQEWTGKGFFQNTAFFVRIPQMRHLEGSKGGDFAFYRSPTPSIWNSLPEELHPLDDASADVRLVALQHIPAYLLKPEYEPKIRKGLDQMLVEESDRRVREQIVALLNENRERLAQRDTRRLASGERNVRLPGMILIPAGLFIMGSPIDDRLRLPDEPEQFERNLDYDYKISKSPVTVGQYRAFIKANGYHNPMYWTQAGWKWRDQRIEPDYWDEDKWTSDDNLPVVGVSWYEADAYTRWLAKVTGHDYKLPSEAEWEKAARGGLQLPNRKGNGRKNPNIARIWPWGNEQPDEYLLNFKRMVARSTPVGKFPQGASPYHVFDMAGNVWEWCRSKWASPYMTQEDDDPETYVPRVVRGGSWNSVESYVRCAVRLKNHPHKTSEQIGFRVIQLL